MSKSDTNELSFSLTLKTISVKLDNAKFTMKELTGVTRDEHLDSMRERMKFNDETGKAVGLNNIKGIQTGLISLCLFDDKDKPVEQDIIGGWPATVISKLYEKAQKLSALDEDVKETEKKGKNV